MNKQETLILKGVAILFMVFGHLFYRDDLISLCQCLVWIGDKPLAQLLCRVTGPIFFFLFFSGYGLYYKRTGIDKNRYRRVLKLLESYWIILTLFLIVGHLMHPTRYPGGIVVILQNYTGYHTTYNQECWFLLPFAILSLCSRFVLRIFDFLKSFYVLSLLFIVNFLTSFIISRYGSSMLFDTMYLYQPFLVIHFLFPFCMGAASAKEGWIDKARSYFSVHQTLTALVLGCAIFIRDCFDTSIIQTEFVFVFVVLFLSMKRAQFIDKALSLLGDYSMYIWMIHTWFCYYLFKDFIYSFKYPMLIFFTTMILSLVVAWGVKSIQKNIMFLLKKE